jgi:site-specific DNA-cytosine methylase
MNGSSERTAINVVDLFCGGGGITCGFELHAGKLQFCTVLGVDNNPAAIRIFNANFSPRAPAVLPTGRLADLTWFTHPAEIRLFYLVHCAFSRPDDELKSALERLAILDFLRDIRLCDSRFSDAASQLSILPEYRNEVASLPAEALTLALPQAIMNSLAVSSVTKPAPEVQQLPWCEEYQLLLQGDIAINAAPRELDPDILRDCQDLWATRIEQLREAASKTGYGQNQNNAVRLRSLMEFFDSQPAQQLCALWTAWRSERETIRAKFCLGKVSAIDELYSGHRRAHLVLGGPPCKGFSRMGRPVIQALRDQGVHAWSHKEYGDERNSLMCQYVLVLEALKPDVFLFENVSNFQSVLKTPNGYLDAPALLEELIDDLSEGHLHYHVRHQLVNARHFSVPQDRRRFIMLGVNATKAEAAACAEFFDFKETKDDVPLEIALLGLGDPAVFSPEDGVKTAFQSPVYNFFDENLPDATRKYVAWIQQPDPATGTRPQLTTAHIYRQSRPDDRAFIEFVAPGIRWMDLKVPRSKTLDEMKTVLNATLQEVSPPLRSKIKDLLSKVNSSLMLRLLLEHTQEMYNLPEQHLLLEGYLHNGGATHGDWFERLSATKPCKTIVAHIGKDTYGYWHPVEPRALTIREAARVQSFPDFFRLDSSGVVDTYAVIGNAVPPLLSAEFAGRIEKLHCEWTIFGDQIVRELQAKTSSSSTRGAQYQLAM